MDKNNVVKLNNYITNNYLTEIFQSLDIKFAFVTGKEGEFTQITQPAKCRDYLGDLLWSRKWGKVASIYGFSYNYADAPYDDDALKLSLKFSDSNTMEVFLSKVEDFIHEKETIAELKESTKIFLTDKENTVIVIAPKEWQETIWGISLFTFYLKLAAYTVPKAPETDYLKKLTKEKEAIFLSKIKKAIVHIQQELGYSHNCSGFFSILSGDNKIEYNNIFGKVA